MPISSQIYEECWKPGARAGFNIACFLGTTQDKVTRRDVTGHNMLVSVSTYAA